MPVITIEGSKMNTEIKRKLVKEMTESAANIMNVPEQAFFVFIKENEKENIGVGGTILADK